MPGSYGLENDVYEIGIHATGKDGVDQLTRSIEREEAGTRRLIAAMSAHEKSAMTSVVATSKLASESARAAKAVETAGASAGKSGQLLIQAGYAADDLQYGFKGIANNIQPILSTIPALAGFAGAISIGAVAAYQLYEHWDQVMDLFQMGIPQPALTGPELLAANLKKATEEMEELSKKTRLQWHELDRLRELQQQVQTLQENSAAAKNVESAIGESSEAEKKVGEGFRKAIAESGGKRALDEYKGSLDEKKDAKGQVYNEAKGRMTSVEDAARDTFDAALKGDTHARKAIQDSLKGNSQFRSNIDKFSPETAERKKQAEKDLAEEKKAEEERLKELHDAAMREEAEKRRIEDEKRQKEQAAAKERRDAAEHAQQATAGTALGSRIDDALLRSALKSGGKPGQASAEVEAMIRAELQSRGLSEKEAGLAAADLAKQHAGRLGDEINQKAMGGEGPRREEAPKHIASADFARSVEASGAKDMKDIASNTNAMKEKMAEMLRIQQRGPRLGP